MAAKVVTGRANDLPHELWREIAGFSARHDVLNLRATNSELTQIMDSTITDLTLRGTGRLMAFTDARGFADVETLRVKDADNQGLVYFATRFTKDGVDAAGGVVRNQRLRRVRGPLTLEVKGSHMGMASSLRSVVPLPLAALHIKAAYIDRATVAVMAACRYPVTLEAVLMTTKLVAASCIATLTKLVAEGRFFDDGIATLFASHPALRDLKCFATSHFTSRGAAALAAIPHLRMLDIDLLSGEAISVDVARMLAGKAGLTSLRICTYSQPIAETSLLALSRSATLKNLCLSMGPAVQALGDMASLRYPELNGLSQGDRASYVPMNIALAQCLAAMHHLASLTITYAYFEPGALAQLILGTRVHSLTLDTVGVLYADAIDALLANVHIKTLVLNGAALSPESIAALRAHSTLKRLRVDAASYVMG